MKEPEMRTYTIKYHKGALPGDQCIQWWTEKDWENHRQRVAEYTADGTLGNEVEVDLTLMHDPNWDTRQVKLTKESLSFSIINVLK